MQRKQRYCMVKNEDTKRRNSMIIWKNYKKNRKIKEWINELLSDSLKSEVKSAVENTANDNTSGIHDICQILLNLTRWCNQRISCAL